MAKEDSSHFNTNQGRMREALRNPSDVLNSLSSKAKEANYQYERLYRNLYNPNFFLQAYQNIYNNHGSMTPGVDGATMDGMGMERINNIIAKLRDHSYQPNPVKRHYIPKKNGKKRPLGIPSTDDKLVQEVVRMILESIYEPTFSDYSHGFRPKRSCHSALAQIQRTYTGVKWFVEGDIKGCFDNIDQHVLIDILRRKIHDEHFIALIWKFLRAGYLEKWNWNGTYSGAAQGSVISPILANIYMNELDKYMIEYKMRFDHGKRRADNGEYRRCKARWHRLKQKLEENSAQYSESEINAMKEKMTQLFSSWSSMPCRDPMDANYKRILYCRYADDFLIGVIGSKADAEQIRDDIKLFLDERLHLDLSLEKTLITNATDKAQFLGYEITVSKRSKHFTKRANGYYRFAEGRVKLYIPRDKWIKRLLENENLSIRKDISGKEIWIPVARSSFVNRAPVEIIGGFNSEIRGLYNYYALANNVSVLNKYYYIMQQSMYRTFAVKYRCKKSKIINRYKRNGIFSMEYVTPKGQHKTIEFYHGGFKGKPPIYEASVDSIPPPVTYYNFRQSELIVRMLRGRCELCGEHTNIVKVHQVAALKDLKADNEWDAKMIKMRRKTLVVCNTCFARIKTDM